jgi:hypothetical protein
MDNYLCIANLQTYAISNLSNYLSDKNFGFIVKKQITKLINIPNELFLRKLLQGESIDAKQT